MKKNYIYAIITVIIWATMAAVVKLLLYNIPNLQALFISSLFAFVFLLIVNICNAKIKKLKTYHFADYGKMVGLGFLVCSCIQRCIIMEFLFYRLSKLVFSTIYGRSCF